MKLKKLVALITAGALCLGMSLTAFAADGSIDEVPAAGTGSANGGDLKVYNYATEEERAEIAKEATDWLKNNYPNIAKNAEVIAVGDYELFNKGEYVENGQVPGGKSLFSFALNKEVDTKGFKVGATVYALHQDKDGKWSIIEGKLAYNEATGWSVEAEMDSFSPIAFIKVMSDGTIVEVDWKGDVVKSAKTTTTTKASPKTGE